MTLYSSVDEMIGETPLLELKHMGFPEGVRVFAKLELSNPAGSVKDRVGQYMIRDAEAKGLLKKGTTIVEATAGNTGIGIAVAALNKGYRVVFAVPTKFSEEKQTIMRALGAEIVNTPKEKGMLGAIEEAERIRESIPGAVALKQFENDSNPRCHYETTGPEIYRDLGGKIDYAVMGAGSGGTFTGVVGYLKSRNPGIKGVLADPEGSIIGGGKKGEYKIEGIGNDFIAKTMDTSLIDMVYKVKDEEAFEMCRRLALREGILAGQSSGAALAATERLARDVGRGNIVTILPDRGDRYLSKGLFDAGTNSARTRLQTSSFCSGGPDDRGAAASRPAVPRICYEFSVRDSHSLVPDLTRLKWRIRTIAANAIIIIIPTTTYSSGKSAEAMITRSPVTLSMCMYSPSTHWSVMSTPPMRTVILTDDQPKS